MSRAKYSCIYKKCLSYFSGYDRHFFGALGISDNFAVSVLAIKFLLGYIKKHDFKVFGWYRIALGLLVILYFLLKR